MIKAIFLDIDGTIISIRKHQIPESAKAAIKAARAAGAKVFLCTSRAKQFMMNITGIEYDGIVALTGAHCMDASLEDIRCALMDPEDIAAAITDVQSRGDGLVGLASDAFYVERPDHPGIVNAMAVGGFTIDQVPGGFKLFPDFTKTDNPVALAKKMGIMQVTGYFPSGEEDRRFLSLMPHSHTERWCEDFVDIVGNGISKATGIKVMSEHFGFTREESMAVGDGANDIPMIEYAGMGVAMGNASDEVKAKSDFVTSDVDEDGLSLAIRKFVL